MAGLVLVGSSWARAAGAQSYEGARLLSLAEAQRALVTGNDALYVNAAGIALANAYSIEVGGMHDLGEIDRRFNLSIIDSHDKPVGGGVGYTFREYLVAKEGGEERVRSVHRVDLSLAMRLADTAALGVTARYLHVGENLGEVDVDERSFGLFTLDAGLQWQSASGLAAGVTAYNLTNPDHPETPISWGAGAAYRLDPFSVEADIRYNAKIGKPLFQLGLTLTVAQVVPIRAGISYDRATESAAFSVGLGYMSPEFGIDLGFRQKITGSVAPGLDSDRILALAIRGVPFS